MMRLGLILMGFLALPAMGHSALMDEAGRSLALGDKSRAVELLKEVSPTDPDYANSLLESAKIYYSEGKFSHFFALAGYLRKVYGGAKTAEEIRLLESMALIRHCQYDEARIRLNEVLHSGAYHEVVQHWLEALPKSKLPKTTTSDGTGQPKVFREAVEWPVKLTAKDFGKFNPYDLRRVVHSNCPGGVAQ